ncbi:MAG: hypothetical protein HYU73_07930 [Betaproteobacteria bacterium]|nr:hypothetical protein [Betaproteobacteria bacterium]
MGEPGESRKHAHRLNLNNRRITKPKCLPFPRLMMHVDDIPATGLVQTGSRVWYQLLAAGPRERVDVFEQWVTDSPSPASGATFARANERRAAGAARQDHRTRPAVDP